MKTYFIVILSFIFCTVPSFGQNVVTSCPNNVIANSLTPQGIAADGEPFSYFFIADGSSQTFTCTSINPTNNCDKSMTAWYIFNIAENNCNPYLSASATIPFQYKIYGPYTGILGSETFPFEPPNDPGNSSISQPIAMVNMGQGHYILKIEMELCYQTITFNFDGNCFGFSPNGDVGTNGQNTGTGDQGNQTICTGCVDYPDITPTAGIDACGNTITPIAYGAPCDECLPDFSPNTGDYVVSCWVKQVGANLSSTTTYNRPKILIEAVPNNTALNLTLAPAGPIIDGWQKIEEKFSLPANAVPAITDFKVTLFCAGPSGSCLFDDIRIFPFDASFKSYVYDPKTLRFMAELDERNFATLYEYDEEGKLIRVKKETERGVMTIQENRNYTVKQP
jgi:hypothetical protein